ncbi:hypothetical protein Pelo_12324 [Pelomyxa schiedti]|nr:hypothetical protein Pelo_12324 [Pelomyxa schiedti]
MEHGLPTTAGVLQQAQPLPLPQHPPPQQQQQSRQVELEQHQLGQLTDDEILRVEVALFLSFLNRTSLQQHHVMSGNLDTTVPTSASPATTTTTTSTSRTPLHPSHDEKSGAPEPTSSSAATDGQGPAVSSISKSCSAPCVSGGQDQIVGRERRIKLTVEQRTRVADYELQLLRVQLHELQQLRNNSLAEIESIKDKWNLRLAALKRKEYELHKCLSPSIHNSTRQRDSASQRPSLQPDTLNLLQVQMLEQERQVQRLQSHISGLRATVVWMLNSLKRKESALARRGVHDDPKERERLETENREMQTQIGKLNLELVATKKNLMQTTHQLNKTKETLNALLKKNSSLAVQLKQNREWISRIRDEGELLSRECHEAEITNKELTQLRTQTKTEIPGVFESVQQQATLLELDKQIASWKRKIEIASIATKNHH